MTDSALADNAPQTERLFTLAEVAKLVNIPATGIFRACRAGALPGAVLAERNGREVFLLTGEALGWLQLTAEREEKNLRRAHDRTCGMLRIGGSYHAMRGAFGSNGRRRRHG